MFGNTFALIGAHAPRTRARLTTRSRRSTCTAHQLAQQRRGPRVAYHTGLNKDHCRQHIANVAPHLSGCVRFGARRVTTSLVGTRRGTILDHNGIQQRYLLTIRPGNAKRCAQTQAAARAASLLSSLAPILNARFFPSRWGVVRSSPYDVTAKIHASFNHGTQPRHNLLQRQRRATDPKSARAHSPNDNKGASGTKERRRSTVMGDVTVHSRKKTPGTPLPCGEGAVKTKHAPTTAAPASTQMIVATTARLDVPATQEQAFAAARRPCAA